MMSISLRTLNLVGGAALVLTTAGMVSAAETPDSWITTKTKVAVLSAVGTSATGIRVETVDGLLTLHGTVASAEDKAAAEEAAKKIDGVKKVRNLLEVVTSEEKEAVATSDSAIETRIKAALKSDAALKDETGIKVESVNKGTVLLSGKATTLENHLRAIEDARAIPGVKRVSSAIESPDSKAIRQHAMPHASDKH
jgi:hyperosmotically inducible protein